MFYNQYRQSVSLSSLSLGDGGLLLLLLLFMLCMDSCVMCLCYDSHQHDSNCRGSGTLLQCESLYKQVSFFFPPNYLPSSLSNDP